MTKMRKISRILFSSLLVVVLLLHTAGCGFGNKSNSGSEKLADMEIEEIYKYSYDIIGGDDVMPIMGFYGPRPNNYSYNANVLPDYYSDEFFGLIQEAGINLIGTTFTDYPTQPSFVYRMLEQGEKYNIGAVIRDPAIVNTDESITLEEVDERINHYNNYPAFCGLYVTDEPGTPYFRGAGQNYVSDFERITTQLKQLNCPYYVNLYGRLVGTEKDPRAKEVYEQYVKEFTETLKPDYLLVDRYIFDENLGLNRDYLHFQNLESIRKQAEESKIAFWAFVQAGSQWNDAKEYFDSNGYFPSRGEFFWMTNTILAYGAKGIAYFPLLQPYWFAYAESEPFDFQRNGLIGAMGNRTRWFYYAKDMNEQIRAIDEILMNSVNKGVIASGSDANRGMNKNQYLIEDGSFRELKNVEGDALVGCFNYKGKTALYVVNYDIEYAQKINLDLAYECNVEIIQEAKTSRVCGDSIELELAAGDGALVVFR